MKNLKKQIETGTVKPIYLICGEDSKLREDAVKLIESAVISQDGYKENFEGDFDTDELINSANTLNLFGGAKLIIIKDSDCFRKSGYEKLIFYFKKPNPDCVMVFNERKIDKRSRLYKAVKKTGYVLEFKELKIDDIRKYYISEAKAQGIRLNSDALSFLVSNSEIDLKAAENELEKLIAYSLGKPSVTIEDAEKVVTKKLESKIFTLLDGVANKQPEKAMEMFRNMMILKESPVGIAVMIARQFRIIYKCKNLSAGNMTAEEISKTLGLKLYPVQNALRQSKNFSNALLKEALSDCRKLLYDSFNGDINIEDGIEILILKYGAKDK